MKHKRRRASEDFKQLELPVPPPLGPDASDPPPTLPSGSSDPHVDFYVDLFV